jgi:hypothetical protein
MNHLRYKTGQQPSLTAALLILLTAMVSGCTTTLSGHPEGPHPGNAPYSNILVVALGIADSGRVTLERRLVANIAAGGSAAKSSIALAPKMADAPRTSEQIKSMLNETGADALLLVRLADSSAKLGKTQKEKYFESHLKETPASSDDSGSWASITSTNATDDLPDTKISVELEATLYDVAEDGRVVYSIDVKSKHKEKGGGIALALSNNVAEAVSNELHKKGFIN